jgi:hypothetical protein
MQLEALAQSHTARCGVTHKLFCEIRSASQVCAVSICSISRSTKTSATRADSLSRQLRKVSQESLRSRAASGFPLRRAELVIANLINELAKYLHATLARD